MTRSKPWTALRCVALIGLVALLAQSATWAHEGPPFPILMDEPLADYMVSVWADPDIGEAQFFIIVESTKGGPPDEAPRLVTMWVEPLNGRLDRVTVEAERQAVRNQMQFEAKPYFDERDEWNIGFRLTDGNGQAWELTTQVESTPPGYGIWDLAIYLFPFLFLAGFWARAMIRRSALLGMKPKTQATSTALVPETPPIRTLVDSNADPRT